MNPEQQQIAIAEACGWSHKTLDNETYWWHDKNNKSLPPSDDGMRTCPDYLHDLNAMHEASDTLNDDQQWQFIQHLNEITRNKDHSDAEDWFIQDTDWIWRMVNATASQRAEAFLRTIGKWETAQ